MVAPLTIGVEEELHLIDLRTLRLAGRAPGLLAQLPPESFSSELQRTTVETNTGVWHTLTDLRADIVALRRQLAELATKDGLGIAAVGTVPLSTADDFELTSTGRFARMQHDYRLLVEEQLICGTQVHVGVDNRDLAIAVAQRVGRDLPLLLALSTSSPIWHGSDTGYASIRSIIWQRWPTSGMPGPMSTSREYDELLADLISSGVITDTKMAYFDIRPSAHVPTVELRVCDACPLVDDAILIAGLFRALVADAVRAIEADTPLEPVAAPLHRGAMWRAARSGLSGDLLDGRPRPLPVPAGDAVRGLLTRLRPQLEDFGDWDTVRELAEATLSRGTSADRQRAALAERGQLADVVLQVVAETQDVAPIAGAPIPQAPRILTGDAGYEWSAGDEAFASASSLRPLYRGVIDAFDEIEPTVLTDRLDERDRWVSGVGMTFGVDGDHLPLPVDLLPRIISAHEWKRLATGLCQRGRAVELFLRDVYGDAAVVRDGVLPASIVHDSPGWRDEGRLVPRDRVRAAVLGFDLVRDDAGTWRVLEDNARVPSGAGYAIAIRQLIDAVMPDLPRPSMLRPTFTAPRLLSRTLRECATVANPVIALLSDGAANSAWFEHRLLAERAGFLLAQPADLAVRDGVVTVLGEQVDVLYLRLDVEVVDLTDGDGHLIGPQLMGAAARGTVTLENAPGNGVADDKATYCYMPDLIAYYLGERPVLDHVPTYRCSDKDECESVLERLDQLVTKPVDGYGGGGVLIGPQASEAELARRRSRIITNPAQWVAQETVRLSSHPTLTRAGFEPRHVDLRAFVYVSGTGVEDVHLADLALTRVAPRGSMVVNSSRGGGAKDTWILGGTPASY